MKRSIGLVLICLELFQTLFSSAQYYYYNEKYYYTDVTLELGGSIGIINCLTDLGGKKGTGKGFIRDVNMKMSRPSFSIYGLAMYRDVIGIRLEGTFGRVQSYDSILKTVAPSTFLRYERNLSFKSSINELHLAVEVHPLFFKHFDDATTPLCSPYLVLGIGFFKFNPQAKLNGQWHYLHPLLTEGQGFVEYPDRKPYKLTQLDIPFGVGIRYDLSSLLNARLEIVQRILFTDYLDDVSEKDYVDPALFIKYLSPVQASLAQQLYSRMGELNPAANPRMMQRGDPGEKDFFFTIQLKIGMALRTARRRR